MFSGKIRSFFVKFEDFQEKIFFAKFDVFLMKFELFPKKYFFCQKIISEHPKQCPINSIDIFHQIGIIFLSNFQKKILLIFCLDSVNTQ